MKRTVLAALILFAGALTATAQDWPAAPVKIVVPFAAGATPDIIARLMAPIPGAPAEFRARIDADLARWAPVIAAAKIKIDD
jgi:tripartite-type tricarboxylate transporter receptor subunit TctC